MVIMTDTVVVLYCIGLRRYVYTFVTKDRPWMYM